ncbi:MAG: fucose isomerase [Acidobacteriota bacterium]|nr:fucose isomerase [Acidobacteriota bacterium]
MTQKYEKKGFVLGVVPTRRDAGGEFFCSHAKAQSNKKLIYQKLDTLGVDYVDIEFLNEEGLLWNILDANKIASHFLEKGVDAVFLPHVNFGTEDASAKVARLVNKPALLWGIRDDAPDAAGNRLTDTQCGVFVTGKALRQLGVPFSYITNSTLDDPVFETGFKTFVAAARVAKAMRRLRIGQIDTRPDPFWSVKCNELQLLERFGIEVVSDTLIGLRSRMDDALANKKNELKDIAEGIRSKYNVLIGEEGLLKTAAMQYAITQWANDYELDGVASNCWGDMQIASGGISPCFTFGVLSGNGLPVTCEADIHGAISSVIAQAASGWKEPSFLADMTIRHPDNNNAELLWHCGVFPPGLADGKANLSCMFTDKTESAGAFELKRGDITVCRFDADHDQYSLFMSEAVRVQGPATNGTYGWFEFKNWPAVERKLVTGPYIHHCAGVYGRLMPALHEACKFIPGLRPDLVDEDFAAIQPLLL